MSKKLIKPCIDKGRYRPYSFTIRKYKVKHDCNSDDTAKITNGTGWITEEVYKKLDIKFKPLFEKQVLFHCGHDFDAPFNTPSLAIADGEVIFSDEVYEFGSYGGRGGVVIVKHLYEDLQENVSMHFLALYGHINRKVKKGDIVKQGDLIGKIIEYHTNEYRADHLHFCIIVGDTIPTGKWGYRENLIGFEPPIKFIEDRS